jgi:tyrosyl-tRNA synthetase
MSIPDALLPMYIAHATAWSPERISEVDAELAAGTLPPNVAKRRVGRTVADLYHGAGAGEAAEAEFDRVYKDKSEPSDIPEFDLPSGTPWTDALVATGLADSKRAAGRSLRDGAVRCDGAVVDGDGAVPDGVHVLHVGRRRWARVAVE